MDYSPNPGFNIIGELVRKKRACQLDFLLISDLFLQPGPGFNLNYGPGYFMNKLRLFTNTDTGRLIYAGDRMVKRRLRRRYSDV